MFKAFKALNLWLLRLTHHALSFEAMLLGWTHPEPRAHQHAHTFRADAKRLLTVVHLYCPPSQPLRATPHLTKKLVA